MVIILIILSVLGIDEVIFQQHSITVSIKHRGNVYITASDRHTASVKNVMPLFDQPFVVNDKH